MRRVGRASVLALLAILLSLLLQVPSIWLVKAVPGSEWVRGDLGDSTYHSYGGSLLGDLVVTSAVDIFALEIDSGKTRWSLPGSFDYGDVAASPSLVFFCNNEADEVRNLDHQATRIFAVDRNTGAPAWERNVPGHCVDLETYGEDLYVLGGEHGGGLVRIDGATAHEIWRIETCCGRALIMGQVGFASLTESLLAFDSVSGRVIWQTPLVDLIGCKDLFMGLSGTRMVVAYDSKSQYEHDWRIAAIETRDGVVAWNHAHTAGKEWPNDLAVGRDGAFFVGTNEGVHAFQGSTGIRRWSSSCQPAEALVTSDDRVFAVCKDYGLDSELRALSSNGKTLWSKEAFKSGCCVSLLGVDAQRVYVNHIGITYAIGVDGGEPTVYAEFPPPRNAGWISFVLIPLVSLGTVIVGDWWMRSRPGKRRARETVPSSSAIGEIPKHGENPPNIEGRSR